MGPVHRRRTPRPSAPKAAAPHLVLLLLCRFGFCVRRLQIRRGRRGVPRPGAVEIRRSLRTLEHLASGPAPPQTSRRAETERRVGKTQDNQPRARGG